MKRYLSRTVETIGYRNYQELYLDWVNNYLTVQGFADSHNIALDEAVELIDNAVWLYGDYDYA
jgi:hypothetical protein